jgi:flavin-dependent dehydrogenase
MLSATTNGANGHTNGVNGHSKLALCTVDEFLAQFYDYLIIGGGTAGLCVAARLTEDPNVTVGVLEGGENRLDDKNVLTPSLFPTLPGRPEYDWMMESIPQVRSTFYFASILNCTIFSSGWESRWFDDAYSPRIAISRK